MLPGLAGDELCARLREAGNWTPILMLTARTGAEQEARALDAGADDFLAKPFSYVVLLARLRALLRRGRRERPAVLDGRRPAARPGRPPGVARRRPVELTPRQFSLLEFLMRRRRRGRVEGRRSSSTCGTSPSTGDPNIVEVYVRQLRPAHRRAVRPRQPADRAAGRLPARRRRRLTCVDAARLRARTTVLATVIAALLVAARRGRAAGLTLEALAHRERRRAWRESGCRDLLTLAAAGALPAPSTNIDRRRRRAGGRRATGGCSRPRRTRRAAGRSLDLRPSGERPGRAHVATHPTTTRPRPTGCGRCAAQPPDGPVTVYVGDSLESVSEAIRQRCARALVVGVPLLVGCSSWSAPGW